MLKEFIEKNVEDPRSNRKKKYSLYDILALIILASIAGENTYSGISEYGNLHAEELKLHFGIANIASHDTIRLLLERIKSEQFKGLLLELVNLLKKETTEKDIIALDGKTVCGASNLHIVSAWSHDNRLVIEHQKTNGKGTEIEGLRNILDNLEISDHIITIDAIGCQRDLAEKIINKGGDYVLQVKENQKNLLEDIKTYFTHDADKAFKNTFFDKKRGYVEEKNLFIMEDIDFIKQKNLWKGLNCIIKIEHKRTKKGETKMEERFYITSLKANADLIFKAISSHWGIENNLHWVLDVLFKEDDSPIKSDFGAENLNIIRKLCTNIIYSIQKGIEEETSKKPTLKNIMRSFSRPQKAKDLICNYLNFIHS